ncbi:MAG: antitoxin [Acidimicrobiia bacterium]
MRTLYLRNVPEHVSQGLERLAAREGMSVSAFAVRELSEIARRAANPGLLGDLPDLGVSAEDVAGDVKAGRVRR